MYMYRNKLIRERSAKDFDALTGPLVVCVGLAFALCLNFGFKYTALKTEYERHHGHNATTIMEHTELRV